MQLGKSTLISCGDVTAAGTSAVNGTAIDMANYEGIVFVVKLGTAAANNSFKLQGGDQSDGSDAVDYASSSVSSDGTSTTLIIDIHKPNKRYVRPVVTRGTSSTIQSITAIRYCGRSLPSAIDADADVAFAAVVSPADA